MPKLTANVYRRLVRSIQNEFQHGLFEARKQLERQRLRTYWKVGGILAACFSSQGVTAVKDQQSVFRLVGRDFHHKPNFIKQLFTFYKLYPDLFENGRQLSWSHYRTLITIPSKRQRRAWERRIVREHLPSDVFYELSKADTQAENPAPARRSRRLPCRRGRLYTYRVVPSSQVPWSPGCTVLDLGFSMRREIPALSRARLDTGKVFASRPDDDGYHLKRVPVTYHQLYTYKALVERVVDGDTLLVNIDCGFHTWARERLRLKGINTLELNTIEGRRAKRFVQGLLKDCAFIVLKTTRTDSTDMYGRYVADVFFEAGEEDPAAVARNGQFLNQVLLDAGHAQRVVY